MLEALGEATGRRNIKVEKEWGWDEEMEGAVLRQLRAHVGWELTWGLKEGYIGGHGQGIGAGEIACELLLEGRGAVEETERLEDESGRCYDLVRLLGSDAVNRLPLDEECRSTGLLVVAADVHTVRLRTALDRLKMYSREGP